LISQKIRKVTGASTTKALYLAARLGFQDKKGRHGEELINMAKGWRRRIPFWLVCT